MRLDDEQLNIRPEVAAALGYHIPRQNAPRPIRNGAEVFGRILSWIFGSAALLVAAVLVIATLGWLYALLTTTPQSRQLAASRAPSAAAAGTVFRHRAAAKHSQPRAARQSVPVVGKQEPQFDAVQVGTPEPAPGVSEPAAQVPVRVDVQPARVQYALHVQVPETAENSDVEVNPGNELPEYLPAAYDTGRVTAPLFLVREMPHGGAVDPLGYIPPGICLLFERSNANGWRRVASLDGQYAGYAQVYPTLAYKPKPLRPELLEALAMIRRIP
jgi:hypothetical protein